MKRNGFDRWSVSSSARGKPWRRRQLCGTAKKVEPPLGRRKRGQLTPNPERQQLISWVTEVLAPVLVRYPTVLKGPDPKYLPALVVWQTRGFIWPANRRCIVCSRPKEKPPGEDARGHHANIHNRPVTKPMRPIRCGHGTSPSCPPRCVVRSTTSIWSRTSSAERGLLGGHEQAAASSSAWSLHSSALINPWCCTRTMGLQ